MIKEVLQNLDLLKFFHFVGIVVGLGAVTIIDVMGFFSRKNVKKTQDTISAHHTTKPLIWIGTIIVLLTWILILFRGNFEFSFVEIWKSILLGVMILNGSFLSFVISPALDKRIGVKKLLPRNLQIKIAVSLIISFISWWSFVVLTTSGV